LLAHPGKQEIVIEKQKVDDLGESFGRNICQCIQSKYNRQTYDGRVWGYGKILLL